uniref:Chlororespiratory reduction 41 n=1 Tax=Geranium maderense TaxID=28964 RepID=A0A0F7DHI5_9ROSI|nr:chlororespiratory reduction 41 [Geranium maderense]
MASTSLASLSQIHEKPLPPFSSTNPTHIFFSLRKHHSSLKCTPLADPPPAEQPDDDFPMPSNITTSPDNAPIEKRSRSEILRQRKARQELMAAEPPNYEIGWKRTKEIKLEKPKGYVIADFLLKLEQLMGQQYGSPALLAKTGEIVAERAREEAEVLRDDGEVDERLVTELFRVLRLMEMDLAMVKAAVKEETLSERLEQAKARCRQAILVANAF